MHQQRPDKQCFRHSRAGMHATSIKSQYCHVVVYMLTWGDWPKPTGRCLTHMSLIVQLRDLATQCSITVPSIARVFAGLMQMTELF